MAVSGIMTVVHQHVASIGIDQLLTDSTVDCELLASDEPRLLAVRQKQAELCYIISHPNTSCSMCNQCVGVQNCEFPSRDYLIDASHGLLL